MEIITKNKVNIVLDASKIDLFETCPCRYNYRHNLHKGLSTLYKNRSLDLGGLAHEGLAVYFISLGEGKHYDDRMQSCLMKIKSVAADPLISNSDPNEVEVLLKAVEESCDFWRVEDENQLEILGVEEPFAYVLYEDEEIRIIISGKIDLLTNFRGIGQQASYTNLPFDHKTFSRDSVILRKSNQFINYCNAVDSFYLRVNRIGMQKTLPAEKKYVRIPLSYDPAYIKDWKDNLTKMIMQEYLSCLATDYWPEKPTSCNKFNRLCEYYEVCDSSGADTKKFKLETNYITVEEWDVTKTLGERE